MKASKLKNKVIKFLLKGQLIDWYDLCDSCEVNVSASQKVNLIIWMESHPLSELIKGIADTLRENLEWFEETNVEMVREAESLLSAYELVKH